MRTCIFPGSFDPPSLGHIDIVRRAAALFERVVVAVMDNGMKLSSFTIEERVGMLSDCLRDLPSAEVISDGGLASALARRVGADAIVKGLRGESDCAIEAQMAVINHQLAGIETVFFFTRPEYSHLSSTMVREVARHGGSIGGMVPADIENTIRERFHP